MKIQHSELQLSSEHQWLREASMQLQLHLSTAAENTFSAQLSEQMSALLPRTDTPVNESEALTLQKSKAQRFQSLIELLFGNGERGCCASPIEMSAPLKGEASLETPPSRSASKLQFLAVEQIRESEQCRFAVNGKVCLADGSSRQFSVDYQLSRQTETTRAMGAQWLALQDPLVLDFAVPTAQLSEKSVEFDLDNDGQKEWMRMPGPSSAFLFLDRNRNGVADNGSELFGPQSGQGFTELAALDEDNNGWIDEGDQAFQDLKLWQATRHGDGVQTLAQAGVGALAVTAVNTEFSLQEHGDVLGQIRASSVWLGEQSGAGVLRQIDLATKRI